MKEPRQRRLIVPPSPDLALDAVLDPPEDALFLRPARRTRVRQRRRGWTHRAVLALQLVGALLVAVSGVWTGYSRVMASERLRVGKVEVRGGHFLSEGEVRELLGPAVGENILSLDIDALKGRLRASPWVADATVSRTLPDTLRVEIRERVPLALAEMDRLYLMDGDGGLIDIYGPRTAGFDLPIVRGLARIDGEARRDRAARAGTLLRDIGELAEEISEVEVEPSGDLRVVLRGAGEVVRMGQPPYRGRFLTFLALRQDLRERCPRAEYFDLRFRDRIYAKEPLPPLPPAGDAAAAPPAVPAALPDTREIPIGPRIEPIRTVAGEEGG
ncbi:MAG TPA: FtsQ-type POTRA domain-containing protein [Vicinamibacteria bacterium]|nr:FtsQ-type POTRA domain-containing protein [Vicinamibacteria bacterium]